MKIEDEIKGRFRNEYHKGVINLFFTSKQIGHHFQQYLKTHDLSEPQYNILRVLRGFGEQPRPIHFIKERMLDRSSDVSRLVEKLHRRGLIRRTECATDRRQKNVEITPKGLDLLKQMDACEKKVDTLLSNLSLEEVKQLNMLLDKIRSNHPKKE